MQSKSRSFLSKVACQFNSPEHDQADRERTHSPLQFEHFGLVPSHLLFRTRHVLQAKATRFLLDSWEALASDGVFVGEEEDIVVELCFNKASSTFESLLCFELPVLCNHRSDRIGRSAVSLEGFLQPALRFGVFPLQQTNDIR